MAQPASSRLAEHEMGERAPVPFPWLIPSACLLAALGYATQWTLLAGPFDLGLWRDKLSVALTDWTIWAFFSPVLLLVARRVPLHAQWVSVAFIYVLAGASVFLAQNAVLASAEVLLRRPEEDWLTVWTDLMPRKVGVSILVIVALLALGNIKASPPVMPRPQPPASPLAARTADGFVLVSPDSIRWLEAAGNYVVLHTLNGRHIVRGTLTGLVQQLGPGFHLASRSAAVNLSHVEALAERTRQGDAMLRLTDGTQVRLARSRRQAFLDLLPSPR